VPGQSGRGIEAGWRLAASTSAPMCEEVFGMALDVKGQFVRCRPQAEITVPEVRNLRCPANPRPVLNPVPEVVT
jgi:hypothetical protein